MHLYLTVIKILVQNYDEVKFISNFSCKNGQISLYFVRTSVMNREAAHSGSRFCVQAAGEDIASNNK
jgi:hypothetical protein